MKTSRIWSTAEKQASFWLLKLGLGPTQVGQPFGTSAPETRQELVTRSSMGGGLQAMWQLYGSAKREQAIN